MKAPGWMKLEVLPGDGDGTMKANVTVRVWHPGFWLFALGVLWRRVAGLPPKWEAP